MCPDGFTTRYRIAKGTLILDLGTRMRVLSSAPNFGSQQKFEIEEATAEKAKVKCTNCAFWNTVKAMKINDDLCSDWSRYSWQGWAKVMNRKLTSILVKARPLGDSVCEWVIEVKA